MLSPLFNDGRSIAAAFSLVKQDIRQFVQCSRLSALSNIGHRRSTQTDVERAIVELMSTIIGVSASMNWPSHTHAMLEIALQAARDNGARVELLDLRAVDLPMCDRHVGQTPVAVDEVRELVADAHAYLIGTPAYHGSMSGSLKLFFDLLYPEVNGKLFGCLVSARDAQGSVVFSHLRDVIGALHGWTLPYGVMGLREEFDASCHLLDKRTRDRLLRLGRDVVVYGDMLYDQFEHDCRPNAGAEFGFAAWHGGRAA